MSVIPVLSGPPLYRYIPGVGKVSAAVNGPTGPVGPQGIPGTAVNTGATGPTGAETIPSGFTGLNGGAVALGTGYTGIYSTQVVTSATGYIMGQAAIQVANPDTIDHWVDFYLVVNGSTGNITSEDIRKRTGGVNGYANLNLIHRSGLVGPGTWTTTIYGRVQDLSSTSNVVVDHIDLFTLGNLR